TRARGGPYLASMGITLSTREALLEMLNTKPLATDFGKEIFPRAIRTHRVHAHLFDGYWEDLGTIKAYHEASLALASDNPPFDFHNAEGVIYTRMRFLPASRISAAAEQCLISDRCLVEAGTRLARCGIGVRSPIGPDATPRDVVMIGADRIETDAERAANEASGIPSLSIGDGCVIERAILDKDCRIGRRVQIVNRRGLVEGEGPNYAIRDGI